MSAGNPKGWPKSEMNNYGIPKPVFVIPAAYVNKQAAEWPPGHTIDPCVIPPPEVTLVDGILTIHGTSIDLNSLILGIPGVPTADLAIEFAGLYLTGETVDYQTSMPGNNPSEFALQVKVVNVGSVTVPNAKVVVSANSLFASANTYSVVYGGGATGPATVAGAALKNPATGLVVTSMPAGSYFFINGVPQVYSSPVLVNNSVRVTAGALGDKNPETNYESFAVNVTAPV